MTVIYIATVGLIFFAAWFMKVRMGGHSKRDVVLKMLAALCFVVVSGTAVTLNLSVLACYFLAGAIFGALGDLFLGLSHLDKQKKQGFMFMGLLWFGLGHVAYCQGLIHKYSTGDSMPYILIPLVIGILIATLVGMSGRKLGLHFGRYLPAVMVYVFLLSFSVLLSFSLNLYYGFHNQQLKIFLIGILMFIISDSILSRMYFGKQKHPSLNVVTNHVTYYLAQWLIAISILFL